MPKISTLKMPMVFIPSMKKIPLLVNSLHVYEWFDLAILKENAGEARMCMA